MPRMSSIGYHPWIFWYQHYFPNIRILPHHRPDGHTYREKLQQFLCRIVISIRKFNQKLIKYIIEICSYSNNLLIKLYVEGLVGSIGPNLPSYWPWHAVRISGWDTPHDLVCPGVSNSGITLMPRIRAASITRWTSAGVYMSRGWKAPCALNSGKTWLWYGKLWSSTMCQWSTFNLLYAMPSRILNKLNTLT